MLLRKLNKLKNANRKEDVEKHLLFLNIYCIIFRFIYDLIISFLIQLDNYLLKK
jgi:hypothetical protein